MTTNTQYFYKVALMDIPDINNTIINNYIDMVSNITTNLAVFVGIRGTNYGSVSSVSYSSPLLVDRIPASIDPNCLPDLTSCAASVGITGATAPITSPIIFVTGSSRNNSVTSTTSLSILPPYTITNGIQDYNTAAIFLVGIQQSFSGIDYYLVQLEICNITVYADPFLGIDEESICYPYGKILKVLPSAPYIPLRDLPVIHGTRIGATVTVMTASGVATV